MKNEQSVADRAAELLRAARQRRNGIDDDEVIATAMLAGAARHRRRTWTRGVAAGSGVLAMAAAVALAVLGPEPAVPESAPSGELLAIQLATGDRLAAVAGASFRVDEGDGAVRRLALTRGAMLFDVQPLAAGERFEVVTPDATVTVVGTVFAVETGPGGTSVEVFEGRVRVRDREGERALSAGEVDRGDRTRGGIAQLAAEGREAASRRARRAEAAPAPPPEAPPAPVPGEALRAPEAIEQVAPAPAPASREAARREAPPRAPDPREAPSPPAVDEVRGWIASGRIEEALAAAHAQRGGRWRFVEADALRALRRWSEAAPMYEQAGAELAGLEGAQAAYLAASLWLTEIGDPRAAIGALDRGAVDAPSSPLRERGLVLRARALDLLGDAAEVARIARTYIGEYPQGSRADWMRARLQ